MQVCIARLALIVLVFPRAETSLANVTAERAIVTRNSRFRPLLAKSSERLVYASFPAYPRPRIKLETERASELPCELDLPATGDVEYPLSFDNLANGKLVLSFVASKDSLYRYLLVLVVDQAECQFLAVTTMLDQSRDEQMAQDSVFVVTGEEEFDVFLKRHQHCDQGKACRLRYSHIGELIGVSEFDIAADAESWTVSSVADRNFSDGYFYTVTSRHGTVVQRLEQDLQVQEELQISRTFLYSASRGSVNSCRAVSATRLECELRDVQLTGRSRSVVEAQYFKSFVRAVRLFNLSDGSAMIVYIMQVYVEPTNGNRFATYLQHLDLHGHAGNPVKFQEDVCKDFKDIGMIFVRDNFHCFSVYCRDTINTKCAAVRTI
ncbi:uncharacterized protein LOC131666638 [Phymastichus coffea]|uniref:uncharacterized protein LOC131666638 n=1 Tax=Phymastichus coffea TaxID=108790 RepID=UPI00273B88FC|nr:uncharacterized protein LOC131666638 [Phymastichus coffea]